MRKRFIILFAIFSLIAFRCLLLAYQMRPGTLSSIFDSLEGDSILPSFFYESERSPRYYFDKKYYTDIKFPLNKSILDPKFRDNEKSLKRFAFYLDSLGIDEIDAIEIVIQSSPEGVFERNMYLTKQRALAIQRYISNNYPMFQNKIAITKIGESWGLLRDYVEKDTVISEKSKAKIISVIESNINVGTKKWRMSNVLGKDPAVGNLYSYLYKTYYPLIRNSGFYISTISFFHNPDPDIFCGLEKPQIVIPDHIDYSDGSKTPSIENAHTGMDTANVKLANNFSNTALNTIFVLKSNLLYDAVSALNFEVEIPIGRHFSLALEDVFPWWETGNKYCFELWEIGPELRYYLSAPKSMSEKLRGHFVGAYAYSAKYDLQKDFDLCYQGKGWSTGVTYGYVTPIGKKKNFNLEMSLSMGMVSVSYKHYYPSLDYDRLVRDPNKIGRVSFFGPTKAKISLIKPINVPIKNKKRKD